MMPVAQLLRPLRACPARRPASVAGSGSPSLRSRILGAVVARPGASRLAVALARRAPLRASRLALVLLALANPSLVREDREPVKDVVAVVVDRSALADARRPRRADRAVARRNSQRRFGALTDVEPRFIEAGDSERRRRHPAVRRARPRPRRRAAGAARRRHHGHRRRGARHPGIGRRARLQGAAARARHRPRRTSATGRSSSSRRRASASSARTRRSAPRSMERGGTEPRAASPCAATASRSPAAPRPAGRRSRCRSRIEHGGPNIVEIEVEAARRTS